MDGDNLTPGQSTVKYHLMSFSDKKITKCITFDRFF